MKKLLNYTEVKRQSETVYKQFGRKWLDNAKVNAALPRADMGTLRHVGIGKILVCAAMGESTEAELETLRKYRDRFDLVVNDKLFGYFMERGITPDYVMICDANIPFRWLAPHVEKTEGIKLISTPYANTEWTKVWKGPRYFYVNMDAINTERIFLEIFGHRTRQIPASSNVSNAMFVFFLGATNDANFNWAGYDQYILVGYDYSWRPKVAAPGVKTGKYYAFEDPEPKRFYMNHRTILDINRDWVHTSENLYFSAKWLVSYIQTFKPPVFNCSGRGLLDVPYRASLENILKDISANPETVNDVRRHFKMLANTHQLMEDAKASFEKSREALYVRR